MPLGGPQMKIIKKPHELQKIALKHLLKKDEIGLVATSGGLHKGHISLIEKSCKNDDITIVSIFPPPKSYPLNKDLQICKSNHVDYVFIPSQEDMFDSNLKTFRANEVRPYNYPLTAIKLFNLSRADNAYLGMNNFQRFRLIEKTARTLHFPVKIVPCPIVRERNGLAVSNRNSLLSDEQKRAAAQISKLLKKAAADFKSKPIEKVLQDALKEAAQMPLIKIKKAQIVDFFDMSQASSNTKKAVFLMEFQVGKAVLRDNIEMIKKFLRAT
jgi:pantoate--beta-alanine ligase